MTLNTEVLETPFGNEGAPIESVLNWLTRYVVEYDKWLSNLDARLSRLEDDR